MSDNNLRSSKYTISNISSTTTDSKIVKRPYANIPFSSGKRQDKSNSFKDTLKSLVSNNSPNSDSEDFSNLLSSELSNIQRLESAENSRLVRSNFENNTLSNINDTDTESNFEDKFNNNMKTKDNSSELYKKIYLVNALRKGPSD